MKQDGKFLYREKGLTLVELLIAMVIGLLGILIISEALISSDKYKRSTISAGDAQTNGALSLFTMERDMRMAGAGFANSQILGCNPLQYRWNGVLSKPANPSSTLPDLSMAPVVIVNGVLGTGVGPDTITIAYSDEDRRSIPGQLNAAFLTSFRLQLKEAAGFSVNDLAVLAQPGKPCTMFQVTSVTPPQDIFAANTSFNDLSDISFPTYTEGALIFNLGKPVFRRYEIVSDNLHLTSYFIVPAPGSMTVFNNTSDLLYNNIVDLQAEYGKDNGAGGGTANDGVVDEFNAATPANSAEWQQVLAIRIGILARSSNREKETGSPAACEATTTAPSWAGGNFTVPGGIPSCHKFRVFETIVPLRNMIWRES